MGKYRLFHPDTQILGSVIVDFQQAIDSDEFLPILRKHGLDIVAPDRWYAAQLWVDVLNEISTTPGAMMNFVSIGMRQMELVNWPPEFARMSLLEVMQSLDEVYQQYYRGTDAGSIRAEAVSPRHIKVTVRSFEPDDLWYGNLYQLCRQFAPLGSHFTLDYDPDEPRHEDGGDRTVFHMTW
jgi:hypothetical protein